jgi:hypothetical protein
VDRAARCVSYAGAISFVVSWLIAKWLQGAAAIQPRIATGIYRFAYRPQSQVIFLTEGQAAWGAGGAYSGIWMVVGRGREMSGGAKGEECLDGPRFNHEEEHRDRQQGLE